MTALTPRLHAKKSPFQLEERIQFSEQTAKDHRWNGSFRSTRNEDGKFAIGLRISVQD